MRLRHRAGIFPGKASPDPELTSRLEAARLYVITPDSPRLGFQHFARAAIRGGADIIQLRQKTITRGELLILARALRDEIRDALFIVNDYVDIALMSGADGVHLGPDDLTVASARKVAGDRLLIGVSASKPEAVQPGADYVGCGPAFATPLKPSKAAIGPEGVAALTKAMEIPVFGIGGIDETNVQLLTAVGVHRVCVIRAIAEAGDPEQAVRRLRAMLTP